MSLLEIGEDAIAEVAKIAAQVNESVENIGARRLQTVMEKLLEDISFEAEEHTGETITIDAAYVRERLTDLGQRYRSEQIYSVNGGSCRLAERDHYIR